ncbi:putative RING-H2 finger protein ATL12 [Neltuma alba]|uniref:putative RING-H2 finger protein ATL12 n=1 Tax=Neltuma alba TaxID=207710 RepID=UPI0010A34327|nr:putative RING-H2 finger protein ATL12 [Prosopis alba]
MLQDRLQEMYENLCGHSFINCLLLFFMFSTFLPNAQARDPERIHLSTEMTLVMLSIMFTIILGLIAYIKFCGTSSSELLNQSVHPQSLARSEQSRFYGIDKQVIEALPVFEFSFLKGSKEGLECVVCLSRFENSETLRLLPKCKHAFHMNCIDMWLEGHSTCPLCRCRVDPGDVKGFTSSISSRFLSVPSNLTEEPNLEILVQREQSRQESLRINYARGLWNVEEGRKEEELLIDNGGNREILHKFHHRIVISGFVMRSRWSDLTATDLLLLNSEMLSVMSNRRFLASESANGESSRWDSNLSGTSNEEQHSYQPLNWGRKRSLSEITIVPRLKEINRMKKLAASGDNNGGEERSWRIWWPIARRTVLGFARRERSSTELESKQLGSSV